MRLITQLFGLTFTIRRGRLLLAILLGLHAIESRYNQLWRSGSAVGLRRRMNGEALKSSYTLPTGSLGRS